MEFEPYNYKILSLGSIFPMLVPLGTVGSPFFNFNFILFFLKMRGKPSSSCYSKNTINLCHIARTAASNGIGAFNGIGQQHAERICQS